MLCAECLYYAHKKCSRLYCKRGSLHKACDSFVCTSYVIVNPVVLRERPNVTINSKFSIEVIDRFCYLGGITSMDSSADAAVTGSGVVGISSDNIFLFKSKGLSRL